MELVNVLENEHLSMLNHSCAHMMAQAVKRLYPNAKFWVGPVISEGFYYDMDLGDVKLKEEDLAKIEKEMKKIAKDGKRIVREEISKEDALEMFKDDPYKIDLINGLEEWKKIPYLVLKGAYSYVNCKQILNNISGIYSTSLGKAESLTAEEINRLIGVTVDFANKKVYANSDPNTNIDEWGVLGNQYPYKETDYTPESYINSKANATAGTKTDPATAYGYQWGNLTINDTLKTILFNGTTSDANYAKSYWLASPAVDADSGRAYFGPGDVAYGGVDAGGGLFGSGGRWFAASFGVRPVVYLESNITVEDLHKIDGQEEDWSAYSNSDPAVAHGNSSNGEAGNHGTESGGGGPV